MRFLVADIESYFDDDYTFSKLSTEQYTRDARFSIHGCAFYGPNTPSVWYDRHALPAFLASVDWSDVFLISHHAQWDHLALSHHYGIHPRMSGCTLSMARLMIGNHLSVSLEAVRKHFGLHSKTTPYHLFKGKHWDELSPAAQQHVAAGAIDEAQSIWWIFQKFMAEGFPVDELEIIDLTIKMFSNPILEADVGLLADVWEREGTLKQQRMAELIVTDADLQSADRFAQLLRDEGVEPETKDGKNGPIWAFAKTDQQMRDLLEHDNPRIRTLVEARLGAKSTLMQTRAETLGFMSTRGPLPCYLRYCGAHTTRWSGGDGCLVGDTSVLVFDHQKGLTTKRIVDILSDDLIWDGEELVAHDGIAFSGYQEVIEHDGVRGTGGHIVYDISGKEVALAEAARMGTRLMDCPAPNSKRMAAVRKRD